MNSPNLRRCRCALGGISLLLLLFTSACGFRLQGRMPLPVTLKVVHIDSEDAQSDFVHALRDSLRSSGATLKERGDPMTAEIRITEDKITERVLTVSARNIPTDYELTYDVEIAVSVAGRDVLSPEKLSLSRVYSFDESKLLAKEREKEVLLDALARDMASVVLRRLSSL
ncbi:MAG: LPS assembly lipoprotein LptE [Pseudomonadota bacterium]